MGEVSVSGNTPSLNLYAHDVINLSYYEDWTDKRNYSNAIKNLTLWSGNKHVECGIYISYLN